MRDLGYGCLLDKTPLPTRKKHTNFSEADDETEDESAQHESFHHESAQHDSAKPKKKYGQGGHNLHKHNEDVKALPCAKPSAHGWDVSTDVTNLSEPAGGQENSLHHRFFSSNQAALTSLAHYAQLATQFATTAATLMGAAMADYKDGPVSVNMAVQMDKMRYLNQMMAMIASGVDGGMALPRLSTLMMAAPQHPSSRKALEDYYRTAGSTYDELLAVHEQMEALQQKQEKLFEQLEIKREVVENESLKAALYACEARVSRGRGTPPVEHRALETMMTALRVQLRQHLLHANHHLNVAESSKRFPRMRVMLGIEHICNNDLRGISNTVMEHSADVEGFYPPNPETATSEQLLGATIQPSTGGERTHKNVKNLHLDDMGLSVGVEGMKKVFGEHLATGLPEEIYQVEMERLKKAALEKASAANKDETEEERMERIRAKLDKEEESKKRTTFVALGENLHIVQEGTVTRSITPFNGMGRKSSLAGRLLNAVQRQDVDDPVTTCDANFADTADEELFGQNEEDTVVMAHTTQEKKETGQKRGRKQRIVMDPEDAAEAQLITGIAAEANMHASKPARKKKRTAVQFVEPAEKENGQSFMDLLMAPVGNAAAVDPLDQVIKLFDEQHTKGVTGYEMGSVGVLTRMLTRDDKQIAFEEASI